VVLVSLGAPSLSIVHFVTSLTPVLLDIAGSYKVRGILNQLRHFRRSQSMPTECPLVTLSAGNYGKAFAYLTSDFRRRLVLMPTTAPDDRQTVIEVA